MKRVSCWGVAPPGNIFAKGLLDKGAPACPGVAESSSAAEGGIFGGVGRFGPGGVVITEVSPLHKMHVCL